MIGTMSFNVAHATVQLVVRYPCWHLAAGLCLKAEEQCRMLPRLH